jgi:hypothetical protein
MSERVLCSESYCPACGAPCQKRQDHQGMHDCINCGTKWWDEAGELEARIGEAK